uniref:DUF5641 domain-containing protein n=1 Tax=Wuchereria bancrofti TaxID=6293 RepID=A0AAF5Q5P4_WUCBA
MTWKNIVPKAPWQGGIYKRLIGLTKNALKRAIGRKFLAERELVTPIAEVEGIFNTRPLTYVNVIIRPVDCILPNVSLHLPMIKNDDTQEEFIPHRLDTRKRLDIKINKDGEVRNIQVETSTGKLLDRPINILHLLEVNDEEIHLEPNKKKNMKIPNRTQRSSRNPLQCELEKEKYFFTMDMALCRILKPQKIVLHKTENISLWNVEQITRKCLYSEVRIFNAQIYENHVINKTFRSENCNFTNPSLTNGGILIDIVTKITNARSRRNTNLALACKSDSKIIEIKGGLISKFEIDKVNAVLEILAQNQRIINPNFKPQETTKFWDELSQEGEELSEQLEGEFEKTTAYLQAKLEQLFLHWKLIINGLIILVISIVLIAFKSNFTLIHPIFNLLCCRNPNLIRRLKLFQWKLYELLQNPWERTHQTSKLQFITNLTYYQITTFSGRECRKNGTLKLQSNPNILCQLFDQSITK